MDNEPSVDAKFFARPVDKVAEDLIGRRLTVSGPAAPISSIIVETEAYGGVEDPASHAAFKPGGRASIMWEAPGTIYVYAAYGVYPCLNIVTGSRGNPEAVLIRGILPVGSTTPVLGPGRAAIALGVSLDDHGHAWDGARFEVGAKKLAMNIERTPRIGISRGTDILWRFVATLEQG